jgi:hypothetical protein
MPEENAKPWSGEGLPPVGTVCKFHRKGNTYCFKEDLFDGHVVTIIAHYQGVTGHTVAAFTFDDEDGNTRDVESATERHFSPCLTPEQIAAEERATIIREMASAAHRPGQIAVTKREMAERLYDAGYRKRVTP